MRKLYFTVEFRDWRPLLLFFFYKNFCKFFAKNLQNILQNICKKCEKKIFFCVKFLQIWNLHTDFRPREESVSFYEINHQMILPIC